MAVIGLRLLSKPVYQVHRECNYNDLDSIAYHIIVSTTSRQQYSEYKISSVPPISVRI